MAKKDGSSQQSAVSGQQQDSPPATKARREPSTPEHVVSRDESFEMHRDELAVLSRLVALMTPCTKAAAVDRLLALDAERFEAVHASAATLKLSS